MRCLAQLEQSLLASGHRDFRMVVVGQGAEATWLRRNMQHAEFMGVLTGKNLSRAFANMDLFVFPSETDTFGLAVLEALSSGVPAVVTAVGGPKYTVQHGKTGYVANTFDDFVYIHRASADPTGLALADGFSGARTCSFDLVGADFRGHVQDLRALLLRCR